LLKLVEVAGIEPASKDTSKAESTYLVVFRSYSPVGKQSNQIPKSQFLILTSEPKRLSDEQLPVTTLII